MAKRRNIGVIGAGWAGCAAAVELARRGCEVHLYEAARTPGGRARRIELDGRALDNGQHILLGAYRDTLYMMHVVGLEPAALMLRLPLQMRYPDGGDGMQLVAPRLPAPLHMAVGVLRARGLSAADKLAMARFASAARWMDWRLDVDCSVTEMLDRFDQTERLTRLLWRPLCIAALNTPPERASAKIFLHVLRDSLAAKRQASDMLLTRVDLSALFPNAALAWVEKHGGTARTGAHVTRVSAKEAQWRVEGDGIDALHDEVIVAGSPSAARALLSGLVEVPAFDYEPITTCYLQYDTGLTLPQPFFALEDDPSRQQWAQFVFDRGQLDAAQAGLLAVVVSASDEAIANGRMTLLTQVCAQLADALQMPALAQPLWSKAVTEKRATFACLPDLQRPDNATSQPGLWLAGDYTQGDYPATIEGAVRSGRRAASLLLKAMKA